MKLTPKVLQEHHLKLLEVEKQVVLILLMNLYSKQKKQMINL